MGYTTNYQIPYPEQGDIPDGAGQMQSLATQVDTKVKVIDDRVTANTSSITANAISITANTNSINALANPPMCLVEQSVTQAIPSGTLTAITFDLEIVDTPGNMHSISTNTSRLVAPTTGWYEAAGASAYLGNATGRRQTQWFVNGQVLTYSSTITLAATSAAAVIIPAATIVLRLNANDYVELKTYHDVGASLSTMVVAANRSYAQLRYVSA